MITILENIKSWLLSIEDEDAKKLVKELEEISEDRLDEYILDLIIIAESFVDFEFDGASSKTKELLILLSLLANTFSDLNALAQTVSNDAYIQDDNISKDLFLRAQTVANGFEEHHVLANALVGYQEDNVWAKKIYVKAQLLADSVDNYIEMAESIVDNDYFGDKVWARKLYEKAYNEASSCEEYTNLGASVSFEYYLNDKEWGAEILLLASQTAQSVDEYSELISYIVDDFYLGDKKWAKLLITHISTICKTLQDYSILIRSSWSLPESSLEVVKKSFELLENSEQKDELAENVEVFLENEIFAKEIQTSSIIDLQNRYVKLSLDTLKMMYARQILGRYIDPIEISFNIFKNNYKTNI